MFGFNFNLPKFTRGHRLRADEMNMLADAVASLLSRRDVNTLITPTGMFGRNPWRSVLEPDVILVQNTSEETIPQYGILGLDDPVWTPTANIDKFRNAIYQVGSLPSLASHVGKIAIATRPISPGVTGKMIASGLAQVQINVTDSSHTTAEVKDGDWTQLESKADGTIPILWKDSGTGTKWAIVKLAAVASRGIIMARITGNAAIGGASNRWKYAWTEQELDGDTFQDKSGGLSGATDDANYALNLIEAFNTSTHAAPGIDLEGTAYPGGFAVMPIGEAGDGDDAEPVVAMWQILDVDLEPRWVFECVNAHDGECEAA